MFIRDYQSEDEEGWLRCRVLSFLHTAYYDDVYQQKAHYKNPSIERVAVDGGQIVGLIDVEYERERHTVCTACSELGGMIWHLAVHPDFQRRGIGNQLLASVEKQLRARGIFQMEAYTRDDDWVNNWYRKNGFHKVNDYLHVFIEGEELHNVFQSAESHLRPVACFAHYTGCDKETIKKRFKRVHDCRCYRKDI
ncbi:MAG: GNAT family N-acetyltransferase [Sporolactobacillus sp.]